MPVETSRMTAEELLLLPADGMRHELVRGELTTMAPAGSRHGLIAGRIAVHLGHHILECRLGDYLVADTGFVLSRDPDTVRAPDGAYVRRGRAVNERGYFEGAPDLVVEVVSPSDRFSDVEEKVSEYRRAGTQRVIVVDPDTERAWIYSSSPRRDLTIDDSLDGGDVVPGWTLPLRELFA